MKRALSTPSIVVVLVVVIVTGLFLLYSLLPLTGLASSTSPSITTTFTVASTGVVSTSSQATDDSVASTGSSENASGANSTAAASGSLTGGSPLITGGSVTLTYPDDYGALANYLLAQINQDRANSSLSAVTLSPIASAQQHADSMLYFGYFSHWDTQGYKPYMRYTLLNGTGSVTENVAYESTNLPSFRTTADVELALSKLEYSMMYNDVACCQNGHRDNILDPLHNRVSIGIAYNSTYVYMVEDFENYYVNFTSPFLTQGDTVNLVGTSSVSLDNTQVWVFYDAPPQTLNKTDLGAAPYSGSYGAGSAAGGVVPPCVLTCEQYNGTTVQAQVWNVSGESLNIKFQLTNFVNQYGKGVYTVYIVQGGQGDGQTPEFLFDMSFFFD